MHPGTWCRWTIAVMLLASASGVRAQEGSTPDTTAARPIKISMPEGEFGECRYRLKRGASTWEYKIRPGQSQYLTEDPQWQITFERGLGAAKQTYRLQPGHYRFRQSGRGWELYRTESMASEVIPLTPVPLSEEADQPAG